VAGHPLDGEIINPKNAVLPSGNNINGGQGVFRIRVLQGDANRDGVVDAADEMLVSASLGLCTSDPGFDAMADLNTDGCVDATDANIVAAASGSHLRQTNSSPPTVVEVFSDELRNELFVMYSDGMLPRRFTERTCFLVDSTGNVVVPVSVDVSIFLVSATFGFDTSIATCSAYTINLSNAVADQSGALLMATDPLPCQ